MNENKVLELFGYPTKKIKGVKWEQIIKRQWCPFTNTRCFKVRKSQPAISIGTCSVRYGQDAKKIIICPNRLLERKQVFTDCVHLLTLHEPGNEFHVIPEVSIPGGSVDYFLISAKAGKVKDFVAIEFQTLDTTGTVWPERQRVLKSLGLPIIIIGDGRRMQELKEVSIHLVITSPPYWHLKDYGNGNQIGFNDNYEDYINNLNLIWKECCRVLHKGCRLCVNIGDQFARSVYYGRYKIIPIREEIIKFCETIGFDQVGVWS